ncbi:unnamed protein product [Cuscuta epithymum]|uniref:Bromo domain-containing protein n=1 Tax=Cuscuta epithymum TaxID=186058 RepID=A0AAV0DDK8_9ASTE|nr:unnamed protein product [Cuscuta epithymum]
MSKLMEDGEKKGTWSTWEELLLAFAVKRHGLKDWDSVAMELRSRSSLPDLLTAQVCEDKYRGLHRRFMNSDDLAVHKDSDGDINTAAAAVDIPWLENLRQLRVSELKQEVQRYDISIQTLQQTVKRMEEEREHSKDTGNVAVEPDLEEVRTETRSENVEMSGGDMEAPAKASGRSVSVAESDHENRSFNESNSTEKWEAEEKIEPEPNQGGVVKPDPETKPAVNEDSCNASSNRCEESNRTEDGKSEIDLAEGARDGLGASKESSDVQSTATLTKKRRKRSDLGGGGRDGGSVTEAAVLSTATETKRESPVKSEPFDGLLDTIRSRKNASMFERRLDSQKTDRYNSMIRRHVDLETIQSRIDNGSYTECPMKFYSDLLLVFNNATIFFPVSSPERTAAQQLRRIVIKELQNTKIPSPKPLPSLKHEPVPESGPDPVLKPEQEPGKSNQLIVKRKLTGPILVCRKRSSISGNKGSLSANKQENDKPSHNPKTSPPEEEAQVKMKTKEKAATTGIRSMRSSTPKGRPANPSTQPTSTKKSGGSNKPPEEEKTITVDKKRGAADFLKRIKKNSPAKEMAVDDGHGSSSRRVQLKRKGAPPPANSPPKKTVGRPVKRGREAETAEKRGKEDSSKRPLKRSRR